MNNDYKLCAKALAGRIKNVLSSIVSPCQIGFIKNHFIGENICFVLDLIDYCDNTGLNGLLLFIDFEKAVDSLEWNFIFDCLNFFNFGPMFNQWIKTIYSSCVGRVINNGDTNIDFSIYRGVRQGCPLSPYLFIICSEIPITLYSTE